MARPRKNPLDINDSLDYQNLYLDASASATALQKDLEAAHRQIEIMQEDYNDALAKNRDMASRIHQMETRLEMLEDNGNRGIEVKDGMVSVQIPPEIGELRSVIGVGGDVKSVKPICLNGVETVYPCGEWVQMPVEHAQLLGLM